MEPLPAFSRRPATVDSPPRYKSITASKARPSIAICKPSFAQQNISFLPVYNTKPTTTLTPAVADNNMHTKRALSPLGPLSTVSPPQPHPTRALPLPRFLTLDHQTLVKKFIAITNYQRDLPLLENHDGEYLGQDRYADIRPWDHNRVKLSGLPGLNWTYEYINASPIRLAREKEAFIATQGPRASNSQATQFWRMVWEQDAEIVIMLTKTEENGSEKCSIYWPQDEGDTRVLTIGEEANYAERLARLDRYTGDLNTEAVRKREPWGSVECVSVQLLAGCELRTLKLVKRTPEAVADNTNGTGNGVKEDKNVTYKEESRIIHHFFFQAWPDHGVPEKSEDQEALLYLINKTRFRIEQSFEQNTEVEEQPSTLPPRIVHCSAGVGRTGTFIALDYFLKELEEGKLDKYVSDPQADPIFDLVKKMRTQRAWMVQRSSQYALIYQVLRNKWVERATKLEEAQSDPVLAVTIPDNTQPIADGEKPLESPLKRRRMTWQDRQ